MRRAVLTAPAQLGVASVLLLLACIQWAHHSGEPRTDVPVAGWGATAGYDVAGACGGG